MRIIIYNKLKKTKGHAVEEVKMEIRLANKLDLPQLKKMFKLIVDNMYKNNIKIWNYYFPYCMFDEDIEKQRLYVIIYNKEIVATFAILDILMGQENFSWEDKNAPALYLARVGVNVNYLNQGYGTVILKNAKIIAKQKGANYLRLLVANENYAAINLYMKNGFKKAEGGFIEFSESLNKNINEFGYEIKI